MSAGACRHCGEPLVHSFCDLGMSPPSNAYVKAEALDAPETFYPLHAYVCASCFLVQLKAFQTPGEIFGDYAYFSSYSQTWLEHARRYVEAMTERLSLGSTSAVIEIASNDGYLLQYFKARNVPVLGIEPAANVAAVAEAKGIPSLVAFFGTATARALRDQGRCADLLLGNNVLAHVPDLNDFVQGLKIALKPSGVITMEFPHLLALMRENQFDTIYHEHFSYFSLLTAERVFSRHGLEIFDVEKLPTHGGSLRIHAAYAEARRARGERVLALRREEAAAGMHELATYLGFAERVKAVKRGLLEFLIGAKREGKRIAGYGAPAKGNTLLNYCGIGADFLDYTVDLSPHKQGLFLPGTHIPILHPDHVRETRPDYLLVLPWNIEAEITRQMAHIREWGGRFIVAVPEVRVV